MFDLDANAVFREEHGVRHRVWLRRNLRGGEFKPLVMLLHNPSTADHMKNDPTASRGIGFGHALGCSDLIFANAATACATDARDLDPNHLNCEDSEFALRSAARLALEGNGYLVAAWGAPKGKAATKRAMAARFEEIMGMGLPLSALRVTPTGWPEHPLYLPGTLRPVRLRRRAA